MQDHVIRHGIGGSSFHAGIAVGRCRCDTQATWRSPIAALIVFGLPVYPEAEATGALSVRGAQAVPA